jgi:hypothetical protein
VPMTGRPIGLLIAAVLLVVIGVSGLLAGLELLAVGASDAGREPAAIAIPGGIVAYGAAAIVAGCWVLARRRWAHRLALVTIAFGLVVLAWQTTLLGPDPVTLFGVALWGCLLVLLLLPAVRAAVGRR